MKLLAGSSNRSLSEALSNELGIELVKKEIYRFPDGELYCRILEEIKGEDVIVVQSTYPDANLVEFLILSSLARDLGAGRVIGVIPYFGYARQDQVFKGGESFTARTMAVHLQSSLDRVYTVNIHKEGTLSEFTDVESAGNVTVMGEVGLFLKEKGVEFILSPDKGATCYAREAAEASGVGFDHLEKTRIDGSTVEIAPKSLDVDGRSVCIVDDIIATGGTILRATKALREQGASEVYAFCAHGLFTGGGIERLKPALDGLYSSDTIENPTTRISAARPLAEALKRDPGGGT